MRRKPGLLTTFTKGWRFANLDDEGVDEGHRLPHPDHQSFTHLRQVYYESDPSYQARFSVPALYDSVNKVIVNNESSEILRMFGTEVSVFGSDKSLL